MRKRKPSISERINRIIDIICNIINIIFYPLMFYVVGLGIWDRIH